MGQLQLAAIYVAGLLPISPVAAATFATLGGGAPIMIAHRGASGYLPEHTLAAYELAARMGAGYIEPDLQLTADGALVAIHDATLTRTTNVEALFALRNGGYAVGDFTLAEIKTLTVEPVGSSSTAHPGFTPNAATPVTVPTFQEVIDFLNDFNTANRVDIGIHPEAKSPTSSAMNRAIIEQLNAGGLWQSDDQAFIQSFDFNALREITLIQAELGSELAQVALGTPVFDGDVAGMFDRGASSFIALGDVAGFADGLGVSIRSSGLGAEFIAQSHALGLVVHGYTFKKGDHDAALPEFQTFIDLGMDGFFANFRDAGLRAVASNLAPVPVPAALPMVAADLLALFAATRRRAA